MGIKKFTAKWKRSIAKRLGITPTAPGNKTVPASDVPFLVPKATLNEIFPGSELAQVTMLPRLIRSHKWAMPEHELLTLGALINQLQPKLIVEFGTFMGGSTLTMAANMPSDGRIVTIDLDPNARKDHVHGMGVGLSNFDVGCLFRGTQFEYKIEQRFANTVEFQDRDLLSAADLVFVDADHTYEFAKRDTQKAMSFAKASGTILWHDYTWEPANPECVGVTRTVNEFWEEFGSCSQIAGTRFALYSPCLAARQSARAA
jgi:hypothetical protein